MKLNLKLLVEIKHFKADILSNQLKLSHIHNIPILKNLIHHISHYALNLIIKHYQNNSLEECKNTFTSIYRLPCKHKLALLNQSAIELNIVDQQWHLNIDYNYNVDYSNSLIIDIYDLDNSFQCLNEKSLIETIKVPNNILITSKGQNKAKKQSSTKRDKVQVEFVEQSINGKRCSVCKSSDHFKQLCPLIIKN